jgi:tRNA G18 (ribose-2'-O)-methylase SpoU
MKLNADQLRKSKVGQGSQLQKTLTRHPIVLVLDNVLDTYNIGSFFRLADALAVEKIYLCGKVVTPPNIKIHRASIGTWKWVPWQQYDSTADCIDQLKRDGYHIVAIELTDKSIDYKEAKYNYPLAIIAGSESNGVGESVLKKVDQVVQIPMYGFNVSLNVLVATSVIAYDAVSKLQK